MVGIIVFLTYLEYLEDIEQTSIILLDLLQHVGATRGLLDPFYLAGGTFLQRGVDPIQIA
jgi:hypothetical protein